VCITQTFQKLAVPAAGDRTNYGILLCWDFGNKICEIWGSHMEAVLVKNFCLWHDDMSLYKWSQAPGKLKMPSSSGSDCSLSKHWVLLTYNTASYLKRSESHEQKMVDETEKLTLLPGSETLSKRAWEVRLLTSYCHIMKVTEPVCVEMLRGSFRN
jgi:hypothetical protein